MLNVSPPRILVTGGSIRGGPVESILFQGSRIEAMGAEAERLALGTPMERLDLSGYVLLPAACEPHAHLDKAMLVDRTASPSGTLLGAIEATRAAYSSMTPVDVRERALHSLRIAVRRGFTAVRTHVNCEAGLGLDAVTALLALRQEVRAVVDVQVVAMAGQQITGSDGTQNRRLLEEALDAGVDGVGGAPALDTDPSSAVRFLVQLAAERTIAVDLHLDETLDRASQTIRTFALEVEAHDLAGMATASHCVSLGQQEPDVAREIATSLAAAGISVVTLPQTNLYLQGRDHETMVPRGLTAVSILRSAGVNVAGGGDNWRDAFNPTSRIDPLETASLLVVAAHLNPSDAYDAVSSCARRAIGLAPGGIIVGDETDLLAVRGPSFSEVIANASDDRVVLRQGRIVARTQVLDVIEPDF